MTLSEIREKVNSSENAEWFNELKTNIDYDHINFKLSFQGIITVYEFFQQQADGWDKKQANLPDDLERSRVFFKDIKKRIVELVGDEVSIYSRNSQWDSIKSDIENTRRKYFTYNCPETDFLIEVSNDYPESFIGAYRFITNNLSNIFSNRGDYIGSLLAYEFTLKDNTKILERRHQERASIGRIRSDFSNYLNESENQIKEYIQRTNEKSQEFSKIIDELKELKEKNFNEWFEISQNQFNSFDEAANNKVRDLEKTYEELLRLKKPAEYWNKRSEVLKKEGQGFLKWLVGLVLFGCITLYLLLWLTPEGMLLSFIKGEASAIKWSIVYVTFISLLAFGIRAVSKVMFSSFHLARDAEEREQLTYVYLALIKESAVEEKDKNLIMQSLFSRADTGLLKDDSGPTMPGNIPNKLMQ